MVGTFYEEINMDTGKIVYGIADTMKALTDSVAQKIVVWDELDLVRLEVKDKNTEEITTKYMKEGDDLDAFFE